MSDYQRILEARIHDAKLPATYDISFKSVFGARAAYVNGFIFASCGKFGFALKLPEEVCTELFESDLASSLKYFEKGHIKRGYAVLNEKSPVMQRRLFELISLSARYVQTTSQKKINP